MKYDMYIIHHNMKEVYDAQVKDVCWGKEGCLEDSLAYKGGRGIEGERSGDESQMRQ
jgi:hypothetical protein